MTEPKRLLDETGDDLEQHLLRAGRAPAPPGAKQRAILVASGALAVSSLTAAGAAAEGTAGMAKLGSVAAVKWIGVLGVSGMTAMAGAMAIRSHGPPPAAPVTTAVPAGAGRPARPTTPRAGRPGERRLDPENALAPDPSLAPPLTAEKPEQGERPPAAASQESPATATPAPWTAPPSSRHPVLAQENREGEPGSTTRAELGALEEARKTLAAGEPARALAILDAYARRFPRGAMAPEADVLRIEALLDRGEREAATRRGAAFLAARPESPYAARIRSLLAESNR